ncbi:MAG: cytochrome P450 [Gammaproteobacteria bacterium]
MRSIDTYPPAVKQHPVIQLLRYSFRPLSFLEDCAQLGETFCFRLPGFGRLVMLTRPEDIREAFRGDPAVLHAGEGNRLLSSLVGETSVLVLDDAPHVRQRRILLPPLKGERMRLFFDAMQSEALATADDWLQRGDVRADTAMQSITLRVILRTVLGVDKGADFDELEQSLSRLLNVSRHALVLILYNLFPPERFENSNLLPFYRLRRRFDTRLFDIIARQRRLPAAERPAGLLSDLLATSHEDGVPLSDVEIRDAVVTILAAGHDTTALALAWALERIAATPAASTAIVEELSRVCGTALPQQEQMQELAYLDAAIRESLRVRNILPFVVRVLKEDLTLGGVTYLAGDVLCPAIHLLHRRADLYPEPDAFRPERFLERRFAAHEWTPFGGGNRACLGQAFALYEMKTVLATLFTRLQIRRPPGAASRPVRRGIAIGPHDGARLLVSAR